MKRFIFITTVLVFALCIPTKTDARGNYLGQFNMHYTLAIRSPESGKAEIIIQVENYLGDYLWLSEYGYHGVYTDIENVIAFDVNGDEIRVDYHENENEDEWLVYSNGNSMFTIQYSAGTEIAQYGDYLEYKGKITQEFAMLAAEYVFLVPRDFQNPKIFIEFELPEDWIAVTPWELTNEGYSPQTDYGDTIENMGPSTLALGDFNVETENRSGTEVQVAVLNSIDADLQEYIIKNSFDVYAYYESLYGSTVGNRYLSIFVLPEEYNIYGGEWSNGQGASIYWRSGDIVDWPMYNHAVFHVWESWLYGYEKPCWFSEGVNEFYKFKASAQLGLYSTSEVRQRYDHEFMQRYLYEYSNTQKDRPVSEVCSGWQDSFIIYKKAAIVATLLAKEIYARTDGQFIMDDYVQTLYNKYGGYYAPCYEACLLLELNKLTDQDFSDFFDRFVYGKELLEISDVFYGDADRDKLSDLEELFWDTNPHNPDTDNDGYPDGEEVIIGADPIDTGSYPGTTDG